MEYFAITKLGLCTIESFKILRECRYSFALMMRNYYTSGSFFELVIRRGYRIHIKGLSELMVGLLQIRPNERITLNDVLHSIIFQAALKLAAEHHPLIMQYKEEIRKDRASIAQSENMLSQTKQSLCSYEFEINQLQAAIEGAEKERDGVRKDLAQNATEPVRWTIAQLEQELNNTLLKHQKDMDALRKQIGRAA